MSVRKLVCNRIKTPDGTIIESRSVHDYRTYRDKNGKVYMVDGGLDYLRRNVHDDAPYEEMSVYNDAAHEVIREAFSWGTYGKSGTEKLRHILLCDMTDEHIEAIVNTGATRSSYINDIFMEELRYRETNDLHVREEE
jgi:hypothetical protein